MKQINKKLTVLLSLFYILLASQSLFARQKIAERTIMIYAQADSILNSFAARNFQSMSTIGSNEDLNIIAQWNQPQKKGSWRYKIDKNRMTLVDSHNKNSRRNFSKDLIDFAHFVAKNYPAKSYILVLWNHGCGILDPEWDQLHNFAINPATLGAIPRFQIEGEICETRDQSQECTVYDTCDEDIIFNDLFCSEYLQESLCSDVRGILFDIANRNYLTNQGLTDALNYITKNIIKKKFEIIGMDACLESMFEMHYQIKDVAHYAVMSEEVELAHGWNYTKFLDAVASNKIETQDIAKSIVYTFGDFYRGRTRFYTQSAIDLSGVEFLKENLDQIVSNIILCKQNNSQTISKAIKAARKECFQLSVPFYVDLHSFYSKLKKNLDKIKNIKSKEFKNLKKSVSNGIQLINNVVIANVSSNYLSRAKGISIYFPYPTKNIDQSYLKTSFVQDSLWLEFLQQVS